SMDTGQSRLRSVSVLGFRLSLRSAGMTRHENARGQKNGRRKPARIGGLNRTRNRTRSAKAPGGWGAEESGTLANRAFGDCFFSPYEGARWAEIWRLYEFDYAFVRLT